VTIALCFIIGIILIKYKPVYKVSIAGQELGYSENKVALEEKIKEEIISNNEYNVDSIEVKENPIYELKLVNRNEETDKEELINKMEENMVVTYKYYEIALNNNVVEKIATMDEAESLIQEIKQENNEEVDLSIIEKYTEDIEEAATNNIEMAKTNVTQKIEENSKEEEKEEQQTAISNVNGIKIAVQPVTGTITSRYGVSSSIRSSDHTGLDIATSSGTPIKVVADGTVTFASYKGSYGNLVRIDHGNGVETWYAHTSKMYVSVGEKVTAGDTIAAVGSTGNSTGAHLHFEIRINGNHINPQNYLY
jgi:murein DD-endopeptidase MepM/ murein hydrolase activator NlpD